MKFMRKEFRFKYFMGVIIVNKKELSDPELAIVETVSGKYNSQLTNSFYKESKNFSPKLFVAIKKYHSKPDANKACKYFADIKIEAPSYIAAAHESDWDLNRALHKAFANLIRELEHKFKDTSAKVKRAKNLLGKRPKKP